MPSSYTPLLRLTLPADGELVGTWGQTINNGMTLLEESAIAGTAVVLVTDGADTVLTTANGAADQARAATLRLTGALTAQRNVVCPAVSKNYFVRNATTGGFGVQVKTPAGTGVVVPAGGAMLLYCDGVNVVAAVNTAGGAGWNLADGQALSWGDGSVSLVGNGTTDILQFFSASAERMRIDTAGNVGIGTSNTAVAGYGKALSVNAGVNPYAVVAAQAGRGGNFVVQSTLSGNMLGQFAIDSADGNIGAFMAFRIWDNANLVERMRIDAAGQLIVGTTGAIRFIVDSGGSLYVANRTSISGVPGGGGYLYVEGGALKYIGSSGTVTTIGPA